MKTIKVSEATNTQLDWLVARALGKRPSLFVFKQTGALAAEHHYTTDPAQMWPIIDRQRISIRYWDNTPVVHAYMPGPDAEWSEGATGILAAARCFIVSKLGEIVEVPEELS